MPLNNHIYVAGQEGYQDNSDVVAYDPEAAKQELDALGWKMNGQFREKDGSQLVIRDVLYDAQSTQGSSPRSRRTASRRSASSWTSTPRSGSGFFTNYITVGDFDIAQFAWVGDAFPLSGLTQIYRPTARATSARSAARRSTPRSSRRWTNSTPPRRATLANELDKLIWAEGFSLPLTQSPGNVAVRSKLANFGAAGLADAELHRDRVHEA